MTLIYYKLLFFLLQIYDNKCIEIVLKTHDVSVKMEINVN